MDEKTVAKLLDGVGSDPLHDVMLIAILALILAILVVRFVRDHLRKTSGSSSSQATAAPVAPVGCPNKVDLGAMNATIGKLLALHVQVDADGVPRFPPKETMVRSISATESAVNRIERDVIELKQRCERCDTYSRRGTP